MDNHFTLYFDGSCGPNNPGGTAAYGYVLYRCGVEIERGKGVIGTGPEYSNNVAEYVALLHGLHAFEKHFGGHISYLDVRGDSLLVINQMNGTWRAKCGLYHRYYFMAKDLISDLRRRDARFSFGWIPREENAECDELSKAHQA